MLDGAHYLTIGKIFFAKVGEIMLIALPLPT
jgi:hypothetical protein